MFYIVEVLFDYDRKYFSFPVTMDSLSYFTNMLENSKDVIVFKVIDSVPVEPKHFGWGSYKKWVLKFEKEHFRG